MQLSWLHLTLLAGVGTIIFNSYNRFTLSKGHDSTVNAWGYEIARILIFLPFLLFDYHVVWTLSSIRIFLLMGVTELISVYLFMKMHASTELSLSSVFSRLRIIWTPLIAYFILGEVLSPVQYLGIVVIFVGCLIATTSLKNGNRLGFLYALLFSLVNGFSNIFVKQASGYASSSVVTILFSLPAAILIPFIMHKGIGRIRSNISIMFKPLGLAALFNSLTMFTLVSALRLAPSGQVIGLFQGMAMIGVVVGIVFLGEKELVGRKLLAAAVTIIGIILLV